MTYTLDPEHIGSIRNLSEMDLLAFSAIKNPIIGIIAGVIGSGCYNKFKDVKLPDFLAFFGGKRFVAIVAIVISTVITFLLSYI